MTAAPQLACPAALAPVRSQGAIGVRYPRPCPFAPCDVILANATARKLHLVAHVEAPGHAKRAKANVAKVANAPKRAARRRVPAWERVPSLLAANAGGASA